MVVDVARLPRTVSLERPDGAGASLVYVDQRRLPEKLVFERTSDWRVAVEAIKTLAVRGAPAIGVAGAAAVALGAFEVQGHNASSFHEEVARLAARVAEARPTAVNLRWGVDRAMGELRAALDSGADPTACAEALFNLVKRMESEDEATNRAIGRAGAALLPPRCRVLTHCNAGSLATVFFGTALGVVYTAAEEGKIAHVYADETRPVGQGARLTVWELAQAGVPATLICDNMAASLMRSGKVDAVIVGADRIARNGDVANKIGTYGVAVLARHHGIPFYVAAPASTFDPSIETGADIPIEERDPREVAAFVPDGADVWNPAFDVTPADLVTGIITERGVFDPTSACSAIADARE